MLGTEVLFRHTYPAYTVLGSVALRVHDRGVSAHPLELNTRKHRSAWLKAMRDKPPRCVKKKGKKRKKRRLP